MQELQVTEGILPLAGGLMMGSALVLLHFMLRGRHGTQGTGSAGQSEKWMVLLGFFLGVPLGVYLILQLVGRRVDEAPQSVLAGLIAGACLTYLLARQPMRQ